MTSAKAEHGLAFSRFNALTGGSRPARGSGEHSKKRCFVHSERAVRAGKTHQCVFGLEGRPLRQRVDHDVFALKKSFDLVQAGKDAVFAGKDLRNHRCVKKVHVAEKITGTNKIDIRCQTVEDFLVGCAGQTVRRNFYGCDILQRFDVCGRHQKWPLFLTGSGEPES